MRCPNLFNSNVWKVGEKDVHMMGASPKYVRWPASCAELLFSNRFAMKGLAKFKYFKHKLQMAEGREAQDWCSAGRGLAAGFGSLPLGEPRMSVGISATWSFHSYKPSQ